MADPDFSLTIVTQNPTVEFIGGTQTQDVVVVGFVTNAHGIYAEARVIQSVYSATVARAAALSIATIVETIANLPNVAGVQWGQSTNTSGLLIDQVTITVASDSGNSSANLAPIAITALGADLHQPQIEALAKQLTAAEGPSG